MIDSIDFVEEDDFSPEGLKDYRVLYVTEPNVPAEGQRGRIEWVKAGGTLVTVSGALARDRYDEPTNQNPASVREAAARVGGGRRARGRCRG